MGLLRTWIAAIGARMAGPESLSYCLARGGVSFDDRLTQSARRALFKNNVNYVEFEPHAYCNRTCRFCPNSSGERRINKQMLRRDIHSKVLSELREIGYAGTVAYARYCEPMAHEETFDLIGEARRSLPAAYLKIISNGDYLTQEKIVRLQKTGLDFLAVSLYLPDSVPWSAAAALKEIQAFSNRVGVACRIRHSPATGVFADFEVEGMTMDARCLDFGLGRHGFDRGQSVEWLTDARFVRTDPCPFVFRNFTMDYDGNVMPCCNLRSDIPQHAPFVLGNVGTSSIFDIYAGRKSIQWRRGLADFSAKSGPCRTCKDASLHSWTDRLAVAAWNAARR